MKKKIFFFILLYYCCVSCIAQSIFCKYQKFAITEGLPDIEINSILTDEDGFLWIATSNGLSKYDGTAFENFYHQSSNHLSLCDNRIKFLTLLKNHKILLSTADGLCILNTQKNQFKTFDSTCKKQFLHDQSFIYSYYDGVNKIIATTFKNLYCLDTNLNIISVFNKEASASLLKSPFIITDKIFEFQKKYITLIQKGSYWDFYSFNFEESKLLLLQKQNANTLLFLTNPAARSIETDEQGNIYFIKHLIDSFYCYNISSKKLLSFKLNYIDRKDFFYGSKILSVTNSLVTLVSSDGSVIIFKNPIANVANNYSTITCEKYFTGIGATCMNKDVDGNIWIGTKKGLYKNWIQTESLSSIHFPAKKSFTLSKNENGSIFFNDSTILIATSGIGIYYNKINSLNTTWKSLQWKTNTSCNDVWNILPVLKNEYWIGTAKGIYKWNLSTNKKDIVHFGKPFSIIDSVPILTQFLDSKKLLWIGLGNATGLAIFDTKKQGMLSFYRNGTTNQLPIKYPLNICEDEHTNIWLCGNYAKDLCFWNRATNIFTKVVAIEKVLSDDEDIHSLLADKKGSLWLGVSSGLLCYNIEKKTFKKYFLASEIQSYHVYNMEQDTSNRIWLSTNRGLYYYSALNDKIIKCDDAYMFDDSIINCIKYNIQNNQILFTTASSLNIIELNKINTFKSKLHIFITKIETDKTAIALDEKVIRLPYNYSNLSIGFTAINFTDGASNNYFYSIDDKHWLPLSHQRQVSLLKLSPGKYTFRVKALSLQGFWSNNEASIIIIIATPFWQTLWFILFCIATIIAIFYGIYKYRIAQIFKLQKVRNDIASDLHDDIGSALTNINILTQLGATDLQNNDKTANYLKRISDEVNYTAESLDDIVWSINSNDNSFEEMLPKMRRYAAEIFESAHIEYTLDFDERLAGIKIDMNLKRDIYLVYKEIIRNIFKHSNATNVSVQLFFNKKELILIVMDNGKGFDVHQQSKRNGLKNIYSRVKLWKGKCEVESNQKNNTTINISIPLKD